MLLEPLVHKYRKTATQVLLRWSLQKGFVAPPRSDSPSRIEDNADIFDFELRADEMGRLKTGEYSPCSWGPTV
jgi:diketogulonate reductase-like aldo/keto reductase